MSEIPERYPGITRVVFSGEQIAARIGREIRQEDVEPVTWSSFELGRAVPASRYVAAVGRMHGWTRRVDVPEVESSVSSASANV